MVKKAAVPKKSSPPKSPPHRPAFKAAPSAERQSHTRAAHANELAEDYVEAIAELISHHGEARASDIARHLGVSHVTVIQTVRRLQKAGLVTTQPYRSIFLTAEGRRRASASRRRHETVVRFLLALGVPRLDAERDAEGIEHHVSPRTLAAFSRFLRAHGNRA